MGERGLNRRKISAAGWFSGRQRRVERSELGLPNLIKLESDALVTQA